MRPGSGDDSGPDTSPDRRRSLRRGRWRPHAVALRRTWKTASSPHIEQIAVSLSTCSARAMSDGSGSNGRPSNVTSSPATITTSPRSARRPTTGTSPGPKNCASSIATMSVPSGTDRSMSSGDATAMAGTLSPTCEASRSAPCRVSRAWPNTATCRPAISARRTRRSSSSVLPANIGPQTTSTRPIAPMRSGAHAPRRPVSRIHVLTAARGPEPLRELRTREPVVLRARAGERMIITVDGVPAAEIGPVLAAELAASFDELIATGSVVAAHVRTPAPAPDARTRSDRSVELGRPA